MVNNTVSADTLDHYTARLVSSISNVEFEPTSLGKTSTRDFIVTNTAIDDQSITIFNVWLSETDALSFATDFKGPVTLDGGDSVNIRVSFTPVNSGETVGALFVSHDGASSMEIFTVTGTTPDTSAEADSTTASIASMISTRALPAGSVSFGKSALSGIHSFKPTTLQFGPDGKLYTADMFGMIYVYDVVRNGTNDYAVTASESINLVKNMPNHDDDGTPNSSVNNRLVTGLLVVGTASNPIIYLTSSDPRIGGGPSHTDTNLDTNSGVLSKLYKQNGNWKKLDLVRGLARSEENHHTNGLQLIESTNTLLIAAGGNTNRGGSSQNFAELPEYALSAAILSVDLDAIGNTTYDLPTLDDETRPGVNDANDPFGGNNGLNQSKLVPGGPVQIYSPGFRNPYDIVITSDNRLYTIDNGPNSGWGGDPINEGTNNCTNALSEPGSTWKDSLHYIASPGYYGGHPNPTRGSMLNTFNDSNPQSPVSVSNSIECDHQLNNDENNALSKFSSSTNGLTEYTASNFGGIIKGNLLATSFDNTVQRMEISSNGETVTDKSALFSSVGTKPLDIIAQGDDEFFPGTIWVADFTGKQVIVFEPTDYGTVGGSGGSTCNLNSADADNDGYANTDEIANGTDPCSAADVPPDWDLDGNSDLLDTDDDNDGIDDLDDAYPLDSHNGRSTDIPVSYTWENNDEPAGYLLNLGFTGLMSNGVTDYLDMFDTSNITSEGAAGVFTIDEIPDGDPIKAKNSQLYGFQFGLNVTPSTAPFTAHTRVVAPFSGVTPTKHQSLGFYFGTGDQDNYIKLIVSSATTTGSVEFSQEINGAFTKFSNHGQPIVGADWVDLYLHVDPAAGTVNASFDIVSGGSALKSVTLTDQASFPASWLTGSSAPAIGLISTSINATPFTGTWDFIEVNYSDSDGGTGGGTDGGTGGGTDGGTGGGTDGGTGGGTDGGTGGGTGVHQTVNNLVVIEAEDWTANDATPDHEWIEESESSAGGGKIMLANPNFGVLETGKGGPKLSYTVNFATAGTYTVWVRGLGGSGSDDSLHVGINGQLSTAKTMEKFPSGWDWSNYSRKSTSAQITVPSAGEHTVNVWMREDGFMWDRMILASGAFSAPTGIGPASTLDGSTGGGTDGGSTGGGTDGGSTGGGTDGGSTGGGTDGGSTASGIYQTVGDMVVIEAEDWMSQDLTATHEWVTQLSGDASNGATITTNVNIGALETGKNGPKLSYTVNFAAAGTYSVWVRGWVDPDSNTQGADNSIHVGINNSLSTAKTMEKFLPGWSWSNFSRKSANAYITVPSAGEHTVNVWMREDGFVWDKLILVSGAFSAPPDAGPASTLDE